MLSRKSFWQCLALCLVFCAKAKASWVSWASVGCTIVAVGIAVGTAGAGSWPALALGFVEISGLIYDIGSVAVSQNGDPGFQDGPLTETVVQIALEPVPDDEYARVANATNELIQTTNRMTANLRAGANNTHKLAIF